MTEVPEHLLKRSQERRAALGLGGGDAGDAPAPAAAASTESASTEVESAGAAPPAAPPETPAEVEPAAPEPAAPEPVPPYVEAALARRRVPIWAVPVLVSLPIWALVYAATLEPPSLGESDPLAVGEQIYSENCATCHGASGGGGTGPQLSGGSVLETFADPLDHIEWVEKGSEGFTEQGTYGDSAKPVAGGMPDWGDTLTPEELVAVVYYERSGLSDEEPSEELVTAEGEVLVDGEPVVLEGGGGGHG